MKLEDALKYTTDTVATLLKELQKPEHNEHRWGTDQSKSLRAYLADALQDAVANHTDPEQQKSLETQAELLRNPKQHVVVRDGQVRAGRFTDKHIATRARHLRDHLEQWSEGEYETPETIQWRNVSGQLPTAPDWNTEEEVGEEPHPYGTYEVEHLSDNNDPYRLHDHISKLGGHVADHLMTYINAADWGWNTSHENTGHSEEDWNRMADETDTYAKTLREAPYEEVDWHHPTEPSSLHQIRKRRSESGTQQ